MKQYIFIQANTAVKSATGSKPQAVVRYFCNGLLLKKVHKFDVMQIQVDIGFDQLVQLAKELPATQWTRLKQKVEIKTAIISGQGTGRL